MPVPTAQDRESALDLVQPPPNVVGVVHGQVVTDDVPLAGACPAITRPSSARQRRGFDAPVLPRPRTVQFGAPRAYRLIAPMRLNLPNIRIANVQPKSNGCRQVAEPVVLTKNPPK
jgi:hypothetical protein